MQTAITNVAPGGLTRCASCGELHGTALAPEPHDETLLTPVTIACACEGLVCGKCGIGFTHKPISNYWSEASRAAIHVPYFAALRTCDVCGERAWVAPTTQQG